YFCLLVLKSLSQMAFYFSNLILQTAKLKIFLNDDEKLSSIGIQQPSLMRAQLKIMEQYSSILELRLYFLER
ncbi:crAss001_48 related protein, partial [Ligilactobacillus murinus]|uniref:crAss001_48 related protein n=2 Tax=Ligilactobacillus murinus TaxID=1622 RepID=UPI00196463A9